MLINSLNALFSELMLTPKQRRASARFVIRSFCKIHTPAKLKAQVLKPVFGNSKAQQALLAQVYDYQRSRQPMREYGMMFWRGIFCYVKTDSCERASHVSGFSQADIRYAIGCLDASDVREIKNNDTLNWRLAPISDKATMKIIGDVMHVIKHCAQKLSYTTEEHAGDRSVSLADVIAELRSDVLADITYYECSRRGKYLRNTAITCLRNSYRDRCDTYAAAKRCNTPSRLELVDSKTNKHEWRHENLQEPIMVVGEDKSESENPALLQRSVKIESEIEIRDVVSYIHASIPRYGKYLNLTVFADSTRDVKFHKWLRRHKKKITTDALLHSNARRYCGVTQEDIERGQQLALHALGIDMDAVSSLLGD